MIIQFYNLFYAGFDEAHEEGMRVEHAGAVFWVELRADIPVLVGYLYYLHEVSGGVKTYTFHAGCLVFIPIGIVEFIAMAVALADKKFPVPYSWESLATFVCCAPAFPSITGGLP